ncbi:hypothetical protein PVK06_003196 [Gossypium arboreum]|uniref:Uncharacterized protein n=1 Tax=Gossypium arboreum TaxID=29729 RepID=A0ABR0R5N3_GOSAR|nr:hypothetical protein PVK06_003196 [Gossypium arboreum]
MEQYFHVMGIKDDDAKHDNDNGGNAKLRNEKWKTNNNLKENESEIKCFLCDSPHMVRNCPKRSMFSAIKRDKEPKEEAMRLGSIVSVVKTKKAKESEKKLVKCCLCCGPYRLQDCLE